MYCMYIYIYPVIIGIRKCHLICQEFSLLASNPGHPVALLVYSISIPAASLLWPRLNLLLILLLLLLLQLMLMLMLLLWRPS